MLCGQSITDIFAAMQQVSQEDTQMTEFKDSTEEWINILNILLTTAHQGSDRARPGGAKINN